MYFVKSFGKVFNFTCKQKFEKTSANIHQISAAQKFPFLGTFGV